MRYTTTSQEIFETFCISKTHKKHLKIDEEKKTIYFNYPEKDVEINYEPVDILYENTFLIVAFKPPFLLVHDDGNNQDTLQARVNGRPKIYVDIPCPNKNIPELHSAKINP